MRGCFSLEENPIIKVWILLLPKRGVKYMQKALLALLAWSGNHRLNIIKPCKMVSDLLVHLEAKWDVEMAIKMLWTPPVEMSTNDTEQGTAASEKLRRGTAIICQSSPTAAGWVDWNGQVCSCPSCRSYLWALYPVIRHRDSCQKTPM